jgi:TolB-like protein/Tfp pilus assembly protein PilF
MDLQGCVMSLKPGMQALEIATRIHRRRRSPKVIAGIIFLLLAVVAIGVIFQFLGPDRHKWSHSLAVLPFRDFSPNKDQEYFCDGMTETIIGQLTGIKKLKVISMTSVLRYKNLTANIKQIGKDLGVAAILEGSIRKEGDRIRVDAKLIDVADESLLWQNTFDREFKSVFAVQDDISRAIVNALEIKLFKKEKTELVKHHTRDPEAYNLYLLGRFFLKISDTDPLKSIEYFKKALGKDPEYALAYAAMAEAYCKNAWNYTYGRKISKTLAAEWYLKGKEYALEALELDATAVEAYIALAGFKWGYEWDLKGALQEAKHAIAVNPGAAYAHSLYSAILRYTDDRENAIAAAKRALQLDPVSPAPNKLLGTSYFWGGEYDRAIEQLKKTDEMYPGQLDTLLFLGMAYLEKAMYEEALIALKKQKGLTYLTELFIKIVHARKGKVEELREYVEELENREKVFSPFAIAVAYAELGEKDKVLMWLETGYERRELLLNCIKVLPAFRKYRAEPRFKTLLKKMGLD